MSKRMRLGLTAVASAAVVVLVMRSDWTQDEDVSRIDLAEVEATEGEELVTPQPFAADPALAPPARQDERAAIAGVEPTPAVDGLGTEPDALVRITAVCVDESGDPLAGVALSALSLSPSPVALSDAEGRIQLEFDRTLVALVGRPLPMMRQPVAPVAFELSIAGRAKRVIYGPPLEGLEDNDLGQVVLPPAGTVVGRVVGSDGLPLVAIRVCPATPIPALNEVEARPLRMAGLFTLTRLAGGSCSETDFDGRFVLEGVATEAACVWAQGAETYATWTDAFQVGPGETLDVGTLTLDPIAPDDRIEGRVLDAEGLPVPGAFVEAFVLGEGAIGGASMGMADAEGRFFIPAPAGVVHRLVAQHPTAHAVHVRLDGVKGGERGVELRLEGPGRVEPAAVRISGRVLRQGEPEAGAVVTAWSRPRASRRGVRRPSGRSDAQGKFAIELSPGDYWLRARSADGAWVESSEAISIARGDFPGETVIELRAAASIEGRVLVPPGLDASGIEFRATGPFELRERASSRSDGTFAFERLQPGSWTVERIGTPMGMSGELDPAGAQAHELELAPGAVASLVVDLRGSAQLEGRLSIGDQNYSTWSWCLQGSQGTVRFDGTFRVPAVAKLGDAKLMFWGRMGDWRVSVTTEVSLVAGLNTWSLELPTGSVELSGLPLEATHSFAGDSAPMYTLLFGRSDGTVWEAIPLSAVDGRLRIECVPAGHLVLCRGQSTHWPPDTSNVLKELEVTAGETTRVTWSD